MTARVVFHIGLEKTGTTSFQRFCAGHRDELMRHGLLYPRHRARRRPDHAALAASYLGEGRADPSVVRFAPGRARLVRALRREMDRSGAASALISAEHLSSRFDGPRAEALARDFAGRDALILVAVRDLHARFASAYGTAVASGGRLTLDAYADEVLHPENPYLDIAATLEPWRRAFGADRIRILDYDAEADIVPALLGACGLDAAVPRAAAPRRDKAALSPDVLRVLRLCNELLHARQGRPHRRDFPAWAQHTLFSNRCRRALERRAPPGAGAPWRVTPRTLERLDRAAARERRWLGDAYGLVPRGAGGRAALAVGPEEAPDRRHVEIARALVEEATGPLWTVGGILVAAARAAGRLRR